MKQTAFKRIKADRITDEQAIVALVAAREAAWNAGDTEAYAQLLTEDADLLSATGRAARGRGRRA